MLGSKRIPRISGWMMWRLLRPISLAMPRSCCCWWEKRSSRPTKKEKWGWWPLLLLISKDRHHMKASIPNNPGSIMSSNDVGSQTPYFWPSENFHSFTLFEKYLKCRIWILAFSTNVEFQTRNMRIFERLVPKIIDFLRWYVLWNEMYFG